MSKHSKLSCSGAHRWLACTPSVMYAESLGLADGQSGIAAKTGTLAHKILELMLKDSADSRLDLEALKTYELYDEEMVQYAEEFVRHLTHVTDALKECGETNVVIESEVLLSLDDIIDGGIGTCDVVIHSSNSLIIFDYKYGRVAVECENNPQLRLYALGALKKYLYEGQYSDVQMVIWQPRLERYDACNISVRELSAWGRDYVRPRALLAADGKGEFVEGDHCRYCPALTKCKKASQALVEIVAPELLCAGEVQDAESVQGPRIENVVNLSNEQLAVLYSRKENVKYFFEVLEDEIRTRLNVGEEIPGYVLTPGPTRRTFSCEDEVVRILGADIDNQDYYQPKKLRSVADMEQRYGKSYIRGKLGHLIVKKNNMLVKRANADAFFDTLQNQPMQEAVYDNETHVSNQQLLPTD